MRLASNARSPRWHRGVEAWDRAVELSSDSHHTLFQADASNFVAGQAGDGVPVAGGPTDSADRPWVEAALVAALGSKRMARLGQLYEPATHEGFLAVDGAEPIAFLLFQGGTESRSVGFPVDLLDAIDREAKRIGVSRQAFIKLRLADTLTPSR